MIILSENFKENNSKFEHQFNLPLNDIFSVFETVKAMNLDWD